MLIRFVTDTHSTMLNNLNNEFLLLPCNATQLLKTPLLRVTINWQPEHFLLVESRPSLSIIRKHPDRIWTFVDSLRPVYLHPGDLGALPTPQLGQPCVHQPSRRQHTKNDTVIPECELAAFTVVTDQACRHSHNKIRLFYCSVV